MLEFSALRDYRREILRFWWTKIIEEKSSFIIYKVIYNILIRISNGIGYHCITQFDFYLWLKYHLFELQ